MADIKINVSYKALKREMSELSHGLSKMTDGYLKEIAEVGAERLQAAYGEEYDLNEGYDGIIPVPVVSVEKTEGNSYVVRASEDAALLEYGTGNFSAYYYSGFGGPPEGWQEHVPSNSGKKDYWYFEVPQGLGRNDYWNWVTYTWYRQINRPPRPKKARGFGDSRKFDKRDPFLSLVGAILRPNDTLSNEWDAYDAYRRQPQYEKVTKRSKTWGVAYGHEPANGIPKAWMAMKEKAEESAKKFYLRKYK